MENLPAGKWTGPGAVVVSVSRPTTSHCGNNATVITGKVGGVSVEIMLDTGSSESLLCHSKAISNEHSPNLKPQVNHCLLSVMLKQL